MELQDQYRGCLLGLAIGDALGTTLEFSSPGSFTPIKDIVGGGPFHLKAGEWTDDTSMALCLAESLITKKGFDPIDQMERYLKWFKDGYLSSNGICFDIGITTLSSLMKFKETREPYCGPTDEYTAGNGSLMRLAPVPLFYANNPEIGIMMSGESSRTTHQAPVAIDACRYLGALTIGLVNGNSTKKDKKEEILSPFYSPIPRYWDRNPVTFELIDVINGSFKRLSPPDIKGSGYVLKTLEAALWAFYCSNTFEEGCLMAVNLGNDSDTTGAIYGQLAGAFYGGIGIPKRWLSTLAYKEKIIEIADEIYRLSRMATK
ncbi:MAG TPA: ADP-ribosylglycohydrolase family protein [Nitrososphaeraceae archaeon]|nr:ADP-ribosylglycohydrolase family protein [Nitrososphaeraceae archaeon]